MQPVKLSPLHQVEYAVADLSASLNFFQSVFGEAEVEQTLACVLSNPALEIRHCGFGNTVQQLCQPLMDGVPHYAALNQFSNCIHNLCFLVDSIENMAANCRNAGFEPLIAFPLDDIWRKVIDAENLQGNHQSYIFDTRSLFGFQLELAETPWVHEPEPALMLPAFGPQWAAQGVASQNSLRGINVIVDDLEATQRALLEVFGDNLMVMQASNEQSSSANGLIRRLQVELGQVRLAYLQASEAGESLTKFHAQRGPAVHSLVAEVEDIAQVKSCLEELKIEHSVPPAELLSLFGDDITASDELLLVHSLSSIGADFCLMQVG